MTANTQYNDLSIQLWIMSTYIERYDDILTESVDDEELKLKDGVITAQGVVQLLETLNNDDDRYAEHLGSAVATNIEETRSTIVSWLTLDRRLRHVVLSLRNRVNEFKALSEQAPTST